MLKGGRGEDKENGCNRNVDKQEQKEVQVRS